MATRVQYLGTKSVHMDTLFGSNLCWNGHGDVQLVENDEVAAKMVASCPATYRNLTENEQKKEKRDAIVDARQELTGSGVTVYEPGLDAEIPIEEASRVAIEQKAKDMGIQIADVMSRDQILCAVVDLTEALKNPTIQTGEIVDVDPYEYTEQTARALFDYFMKNQIDEYRKVPKVAELKKEPPTDLAPELITSDARKKAWAMVKEKLQEIEQQKKTAEAETEEPFAF